MTWFDYSLIAILLLTTLLGLWNGLWWQIYRLISLAASYVIAVRFYGIGARICEKVLDEKTAKIAGCILVFVVVLGATYLFGKLAKKVFGIKPGILGHLSGGMLGFLKGVLICSVIAFCLLEYNIAGKKEDLRITPLTRAFARVGERIASIVPEHLKAGFEAFVKETSTKTKEAVNDISELGGMVNEFKQHEEVDSRQ
ncbi:MAG TPA: CvpA family protein [Candidatus Brocadiia bacterium]|nr:CvpA family protein [Candidatus Brocadiales bacterium]